MERSTVLMCRGCGMYFQDQKHPRRPAESLLVLHLAGCQFCAMEYTAEEVCFYGARERHSCLGDSVRHWQMVDRAVARSCRLTTVSKRFAEVFLQHEIGG